MADGFLATLRRQAEDLQDSASEYGHSTSRRVRHGTRDTRRELRRLWSELEDLLEREVAPRGRRYVHSVGETARDYAEEGRDRALHAAEYLRETARARPLVAIGIAVAATWLIASLVVRRR